MTFDVVTFGETMLRFSPEGNQRFAQADAFEIQIGGSESNTAVGLARLGLSVSWVSRLTSNPLGRKIAATLQGQGVDTSHVVWTETDRVGTYYYERGASPRNSQVIYDRRGSAASQIQPDDFPGSLFRECGPRIFHTTGITLGISSSARATALAAARMAKEVGMKVSFDFNYRAKLWNPEAAVQGCQAMMALADYLFLPERDLHRIFGISGDSCADSARQLADRFPQAMIVLTRGNFGSALLTTNDQFIEEPAFAVDIVERLGGGDAFSAGFLFAQLRGDELRYSLRLANAMAALKYTVPSELPLVEPDEVIQLAAGSVAGDVRR